MVRKKSPAGSAPKNRPPARTVMTIDLRHSLIVLRSHLWVALGLAMIVCTLVAWQQMRRPRLFAAAATLIVERGERIPEWREYADMSAMDLSTATRLEQLRSPEVLERVVASLTPAEVEQIMVPYREPGDAGQRAMNVKSTVRSAVTIGRREGTMLLGVSAIHRDPKAAALIANRYAEQALRYTVDRTLANSDASLIALRDQAEEMRKKAESAERELQEYRQRFNLVSLEGSQNIIVDNLKSLNASATASRVARVAIEARLQQAEAVLKRDEDVTQLASITGFDPLADVARRLADLRSKHAVMGQRYGHRHPAMQESQRSIEALEKMRDEQVRTAITSLRDQRAKALSEEGQLDEQRAKAEKAALDLDQLGVEYNILRRTVESHKATYSQILGRLNDASISSQLRGATLRVSELASPPAAPFSPNPRRTLLLTGALGLLILFGYPFSAELFFGRIRSASDVEYHLNCDLLGEIGSVSRMKEKDRPRLVKSQLDETVVEQFRALHSQLTLTSKIDPPKTLLVTSTLPSEGKSFIAANLAECFVAHSRRTLLVDVDLRRPAQHRNFGLENDAGILRWIEKGGQLEGDLLKDPDLGLTEVYPGLFLLRAGGLSRKATELVEAGPLVSLLGTLQRRFDVMILDTPPAGVFPDALAFAKVCHELIYICRFNTASRQAVRSVLDRLRQSELEFPGIVLNAMPVGFGGNYYYRGYSYQRTKSYAKHYQAGEKS